MEDDWDLQAVVRGCSTAAAAAKAAAAAASSGFFSDHFHQSRPSLISSFGQQGVVASGQPFSVLAPNPDPIKPRNAAVELDDLYKPFFTKSQSHYVPSPPTPTPQLSPLPQITPPNFSSPQTHPKHQHHHNHHHQQQQQSKLSVTNPQRSKKRKNQLKKVCTVPAESLSSDIWAWRKYGQKPIKGSPYPRGYYRCSSSKGCMARKQVERHRSEPGMFIVTYTAEHNHPAPTHRNSLAGSTRHKPISSSVTGGDSIKAAAKVLSPSPATSPSMEDELFAKAAVEIKHGKQSPLADEAEIEYFGSCDSIVSDDFFVGLDGLAGDYFSDHSPENFDLPFYTSAAATTSI